jgi:hypothetical protein
MVRINIDYSKRNVLELIDSWSNEVIDDLLNDIKGYTETKNIRDIELTLQSINNIKKDSFELKQQIMKSNNILKICSLLDCELFNETESIILSKIFNQELIIE